MPKVNDAYLDARRAQILNAAIICFARQGFHRATMHDIVEQSKLSPGAIYNYFGSKEEIIEAIANERHKEEGDSSMRRRRSAKWPPPDGFVTHLLANCGARRSVCADK